MGGVEKIARTGWKPANLKTEPIRWVPKELNKTADKLCRETMLLGETWTKDFPDEQDNLQADRCEMLCYTDDNWAAGRCTRSRLEVATPGRCILSKDKFIVYGGIYRTGYSYV